MAKERISVTVEEEIVQQVRDEGEKQLRSFSQMVEILVAIGLEKIKNENEVKIVKQVAA